MKKFMMKIYENSTLCFVGFFCGVVGEVWSFSLSPPFLSQSSFGLKGTRIEEIIGISVKRMPDRGPVH